MFNLSLNSVTSKSIMCETPYVETSKSDENNSKAQWLSYLERWITNFILIRGAGTGGAGGAIAPPIFGNSIRIHSNSTTNIFG